MTYSLAAEAAAFYESTFVPALFRPWAERLVTVLAPGDRVLDVACGTGVVARAATRVTGRPAVGLDRNEAMLAVARQQDPDLSWGTGDAHDLPFEDGSFDWALCQAALMFFAEPVTALREMGRVAGRVGLQVPGRLTHSPAYLALAGVLAEHAGPAAREVLAGYFAAGDPDELRRRCAAAGLTVDRFETWGGVTRMGSVELFLEAELLPFAGGPVTLAMTAAALTALAPFMNPDGSIDAPIEVHLLTARRDAHGGGPA